jgi:hypothetical protein
VTAAVLSPATYHTPAGWAQRCTLRDDTAEHQIRIVAPGAQALSVSCTCRHTGGHGAGVAHCEPIATITTADEAWTAWHIYHKETP